MAPHPEPLRALTGKDEGDPAVAREAGVRRPAVRGLLAGGQGAQSGGEFVMGAADGPQTVGVSVTARRGGVADVPQGEGTSLAALQEGGVARGELAEGLRSAGAEQQQLRLLACRGGRFRCRLVRRLGHVLADDHMSVGTGEAEGTDAQDRGPAAGHERGVAHDAFEGGAAPGQDGVRGAQVQ